MTLLRTTDFIARCSVCGWHEIRHREFLQTWVGLGKSRSGPVVFCSEEHKAQYAEGHPDDGKGA
jgi:hypothetical protein